MMTRNVRHVPNPIVSTGYLPECCIGWNKQIEMRTIVLITSTPPTSTTTTTTAIALLTTALLLLSFT